MKTIIFLFLVTLSAHAQNFPSEWFKEIPRTEAESWEILPQDAAAGEVILSKRTELGAFSNLWATPFVFEGIMFGSIEGLWQSMKYPDQKIEADERNSISGWKLSRDRVALLSGFEAKDAGNAANSIYRAHGLKKISWGNTFFDYKDKGEGSYFHYTLIKRALREKLDQTPGLWDLLLRTGCLELKPDHTIAPSEPAAYHHYQIYMELRSEKQFVPCHIEK